MYKKLKKVQLEFISPKKWEMMTNKDVENVLKYRNSYELCRRREAKIKRDQLKLDRRFVEKAEFLSLRFAFDPNKFAQSQSEPPTGGSLTQIL